jgi:tRNA1Val (adenine37-N6)-methyltransferase
MKTKSSRGLKKPRLFSGETLDDLLFGELKLIQKQAGYRYSVDALLISDFVLDQVKKSHRVMDLGCGSGVIALVLASRSRANSIVGIEIQKGLAGMTRRNVALNRLGEKIEIINADARELKNIFRPGSFDLVVSNPPFKKVGEGFLSQNPERAIARNELKLTMPGLLEASAYLLKPKGRLAVVYPFERLLELVEEMEQKRFYPIRLRLVFHQKGDPLPILFCMEARKIKTGLVLDPPCFIESEKGRFFVGRDSSIRKEPTS